MTATAVILGPGDVLGGFEIADVLGIGGMAIVYRARQISLDREIALKVLSPELATDESFSDRFRAEGMHAARLDHPNVVPVYDAGEDQGRLYLAMRLVEGMSLAERLRARALTVQETLNILRPIAGGLDAAHAIGLVHRDVKPQNILLTDDGPPYLADFGVAKGVDSAGLTASGGFVGTLNYSAPEQILGTATSSATDVYALAAVLYHCLTGAVPYPRDTQAGLMFAQVNQPPPRIPLAEAEAFNRVMQRGMAKDPEQRYASATELMTAAEEAVRGLAAAHGVRHPAFAISSASPTWPSEPDQPERLPHEHRRRFARRLILLLAAGLAAAAVVGAATQLGRGRAAAPAKRVAQSAPLAIPYTVPWRRARDVFAAGVLRGPRPHTAAVIQLAGGLGSLAAGYLRQSSQTPGGAPPALISLFSRRPTQSRARRGSAVAVYRWTVSGVREVTVWVIPTVRGDLAVICSAPVGMAGSMRSCATMATGARVSGVARLPVGPDRALAVSLNRILRRAAAQRGSLAQMFKDGTTTAASISARLAAADELAQDQLHKLQVPPRYKSALSGLAAGFGAEAQALRALGRATTADSAGAYGTASGAVREKSSDLAVASRGLRREGLLSSGLPPLVVPTLPVTPAPSSTGTPGPVTNPITTPVYTTAPPPYHPPAPPPTKVHTTTSSTGSTRVH